MKTKDRTPVTCWHCGKVVGTAIKTDRMEHGLYVYEMEWTHATMKTLHPYPNKKIEVKERICDYCEGTVL